MLTLWHDFDALSKRKELREAQVVIDADNNTASRTKTSFSRA